MNRVIAALGCGLVVFGPILDWTIRYMIGLFTG